MSLLSKLPAQKRERRSLRARLRGRTKLVVCIVLVAAYAFVAVFAGQLAPHDPVEQNLSKFLQGPSSDHWLGTDDLGRDVFSRLIVGLRVSIFASVIAVSVAVLVGIPIGIVSGYFGGWVDIVLTRVIDAILSFPAVLLALAIAATVGPGLVKSMMAVGIVMAPTLARLMRAQVLAIKELPYIEASESFSCSRPRIVFRHILPNAMQPVLVQLAILLGVGLLAEATLSFLGLGVQPPEPSWGVMLNRAYAFISEAPLQMLAPGIAIVVTVLTFNMLGEVLEDALDPKSRRRKS